MTIYRTQLFYLAIHIQKVSLFSHNIENAYITETKKLTEENQPQPISILNVSDK